MIPFYREYTTHLIKAYVVMKDTETPESYKEAFNIIDFLPDADRAILTYVFGEAGECTHISSSWLQEVANMFGTTVPYVWHVIRYAQALLAYNLGLVGLDAFDFD